MFPAACEIMNIPKTRAAITGDYWCAEHYYFIKFGESVITIRL